MDVDGRMEPPIGSKRQHNDRDNGHHKRFFTPIPPERQRKTAMATCPASALPAAAKTAEAAETALLGGPSVGRRGRPRSWAPPLDEDPAAERRTPACTDVHARSAQRLEQGIETRLLTHDITPCNPWVDSMLSIVTRTAPLPGEPLWKRHLSRCGTAHRARSQGCRLRARLRCHPTKAASAPTDEERTAGCRHDRSNGLPWACQHARRR